MKATKLLGSVALTAALAMGTIPAFAQGTAPTDWEPNVDAGIGGANVSSTNKMITNLTNTNDNKKQGTGSTAVKASVFDADMQVTIPLQLSVAFASIGSELTCPSPGTYQIINSGTKAVNITNIKATSSQFTILPESGVDPEGAESATRTIAMVLDFGNNQKVDLGSISASGVDGNLSASGQAGKINIPAGAPVGVNISGKTNKFQTPMSVGYQLSTIMDIVYTVETA